MRLFCTYPDTTDYSNTVQLYFLNGIQVLLV